MILHTKELDELKNNLFDKRVIKYIMTKAKNHQVRTEEETMFMIKCGLSMALQDISCDNLEVELIDDPSKTYLGYANKTEDKVDHVLLNIYHYMRVGNTFMIVLGLKTIGHEFRHIVQNNNMYNNQLNLNKLIVFLENIQISYNPEYDRENFMVENDADVAGVEFIKKFYHEYLDKDLSLESVDPFTLIHTDKKSQSKINQIINNIDIMKRYMRYILDLKYLDANYYKYLVDLYGLNELLPPTPGTLYNPEYYLELFNKTDNLEEKTAYSFLYREACFYRIGKNTKYLIMKAKNILLSKLNNTMSIGQDKTSQYLIEKR